jgi:transcriptional regulator with XRE-family HTH domain
MNTQKATGLRISNLLIKNKMSEYQLAQKSGLTKQAISNIINEKYTSVKFDTIIKIADGFGMTLQEFVDDELFDRNNLDIE